MTATVATQPLGPASALRDSPPQVTRKKLARRRLEERLQALGLDDDLDASP